jgi:hypothetical protein
MTLLVNSTSIALWHDIIHEAEAACTISLKEEVESYLVFLLARYIDKPQIVKQIMANEFLEGLSYHPRKRHLAMQEVGDKCLIFSGLFPHLADKRLVKISYFVNMGQSAYSAISSKKSDLYGLLAGQFVTLMDVLQSIRNYTKNLPDLMPMEAYELWNEVGSQRALKALKQYTGGVPIPIHTEKNRQ